MVRDVLESDDRFVVDERGHATAEDRRYPGAYRAIVAVKAIRLEPETRLERVVDEPRTDGPAIRDKLVPPLGIHLGHEHADRCAHCVGDPPPDGTPQGRHVLVVDLEIEPGGAALTEPIDVEKYVLQPTVRRQGRGPQRKLVSCANVRNREQGVLEEEAAPDRCRSPRAVRFSLLKTSRRSVS